MKKIFVVTIVVALLATGFMGLAPIVESVDSGAAPLTETDLTGVVGNTNLFCADWIGGDFALVAGTDTGAGDTGVGLYNYGAGMWAPIPGAPAGITFTDMSYGVFTNTDTPGPDSPTWLLTTDDGEVWYLNTTTMQVTFLTTFGSFPYLSIECGVNEFYVTIEGGMVRHFWDADPGWSNALVTGITAEEAPDLARHPLTGDLLVLSEDTTAFINVRLHNVTWGTNTAEERFIFNNIDHVPNRITWNPTVSDNMTEDDRGFIVCENGIVLNVPFNNALAGDIIELAGTVGNNDGFHLNGIDWIDNPYQAVVGGVGGLIYKYQSDGKWINETDFSVTTTTINAVSSRSANSPSFHLLPGDSNGGSNMMVQLNDVTVAMELSANTLYPHINYIDLYQHNTQLADILDDSASQNSMINRQLDVDSGSGTTSYQLAVNASHADGWNSVNYTLVKGWHDNGATGVDSTYVESGGNLAFQFNYTLWNNSFWQVYPAPGADQEIVLNPIASSSNMINGTTQVLIFRFNMYQQTRNASGAFTETSGTRYDGGDGWQIEDQSTLAALNDPFTWDLNVTVEDSGGGRANSYGEFGVYKYTSLGVSGLPGDQSGSGPPNTEITLGPEGNITFNSNCDYGMYAYIQADLIGQGSGGTLGADTFSVEGGTLGKTQFTGAGSINALHILSQWRTPEDSGTSTNTTSANGVGGDGTVTWYCNPGNAQEDLYVGTVIYVVEHP